MNNYIPISRKLFEHPFWCEEREFSRFEAWMYLIQSARFEDMKYYDGNRVVVVKRGQVYASIRFLSTAWNWSRKKTCNFLDFLISDEMIMKETVKETGQTLITICNYDTYNAWNKEVETAKETVGRQRGDSKETAGGQNINKDNKDNIKKLSTNVDNKESSPVGSACANAPKSWKEDFEVYKQNLKQAYEDLVSDRAFIEERQKYDSKLDIRLSMEKAYVDYWNTEAGWKKKKAARSKEIDWKRTFINALSLNSNKVYQSSGNKCPYQPVTESEKKFADYLKENAPLLLNMPLQPTDDEIELLRKYPNNTLLAVVREINNNRYLTNGRNSVYQTILEVINKK